MSNKHLQLVEADGHPASIWICWRSLSVKTDFFPSTVTNLSKAELFGFELCFTYIETDYLWI